MLPLAARCAAVARCTGMNKRAINGALIWLTTIQRSRIAVLAKLSGPTGENLAELRIRDDNKGGEEHEHDARGERIVPDDVKLGGEPQSHLR
jgi:hypothetical protein